MQANSTSFVPATLFRRVFAYLIDSIIVGLFTALAMYLMIYERQLYPALGAIVLGGAYKPVLEARFGWTLGKLSQRIRVIDAATALKPDLNQSLMRYLPWALGVFASIFLNIRLFELPQFAEVTEPLQYVELLQKNSLANSFVVQIISNLPVFSSVWAIADPRKQALHDKLAKTLVVTNQEA